MAATQRGNALILGVNSITLDDYTVVSVTSGDADTNEEYINDEAGLPATHIRYYTFPRLDLELIAEDSSTNVAAIIADFPKGANCTITGGTNTDLTAYLVQSVQIGESEGATTVRVSLVNDGLS